MSDFFFKPKRIKHLCCPPPIDKMDINSPLLIYRFPCRIKLAMMINSSVGSSNHNQCYTVANQTLNAYGKWAGCPGGSGPGYSSTMRYNPGEISSGINPRFGGSVCNCAYSAPDFAPLNITEPVISGNPLVGSTLTTTNGSWTNFPSLTFKYQWYRGNNIISGQTNATYILQIADIGKSIKCIVYGINNKGSNNVISNEIICSQSITFSGVVNYEIIYVNSSNQVIPKPVLNGFTIFRVISTSQGATYVINGSSTSVTASLLIVGGGGSGASSKSNSGIEGGAGGAGGFIQVSRTINTNTAYSIYVGNGGFLEGNTANGENSVLQTTSDTLTALGGGGGGNLSTNLNGLNGGSGGGGAYNYNNNNFGTGGSGVAGQGSNGSPGIVATLLGCSGGGAGGGGGGKVGGPGLSSTITGEEIYYAGGGGGSHSYGGLGGGGNGAFISGGLVTAVTNGLGGGGGGGYFNGISGGSGIVILRIQSF